MILEVDVQPFAPGTTRFVHRDLDHSGTDPLPTGARGHQRVEDERVDAAIPRHVQKPYELVAIPGADPAETVPFDFRLSNRLPEPMPESLRVGVH